MMEQQIRDCDGCRYWSELCAMSLGCGPIEALCLNVKSPKYNRMVKNGCSEYIVGRSIDDPSVKTLRREVNDDRGSA